MKITPSLLLCHFNYSRSNSGYFSAPIFRSVTKLWMVQAAGICLWSFFLTTLPCPMEGDGAQPRICIPLHALPFRKCLSWTWPHHSVKNEDESKGKCLLLSLRQVTLKVGHGKHCNASMKDTVCGQSLCPCFLNRGNVIDHKVTTIQSVESS